MSDPIQSKASMSAAGLMAGAAASMIVPAMNFTFAQNGLGLQRAVQGQPMTPQDQAFLEVKMDAKVADIRTDVRLNTQGLASLTTRFEELSARLSTVPVDLAKVTERVSHLPTKEELGTKLRNYLAAAGILISMATAAISWGPKLLGH